LTSNGVPVADSQELRSVGLFWAGDPPGPYEQLSLSSFVRMGHEVVLYTYAEYSALPADIQRRDAREILPEEALFRNTRHSQSFAMFSDMFRYRMIQSTGLVWADTDMVALSALPNRDPLFAWNGPDRLNNALLYASPSSPLIAELVGRTAVLADPAARDVPWASYGPDLLTDLVLELQLQNLALATESIHPISARELWRMFDPSANEWCREQTDEAMMLHLWNSKLQRAGVKDLAPPRGSFLAELMEEHDVRSPKKQVPLRFIRQQRMMKEGAVIAGAPSASRRAWSSLMQFADGLIRASR